MAENVITIDGGMMEGGGQILRNAAALSCLLCQPITVNNIRAGRSKPGLRPQHLSGLQLIRDICGGKLEGGAVGSTQISFFPGKIRRGSYTADTKTAGSICLLIQAALPCLLFADGPTELILKGGTNAEMAPQIDFFTWVFKPMAARFGVKFECDIVRRGYFPKGGGEVKLRIEPLKHLSGVDLTNEGEVSRIAGRAFVAGTLPGKIAHSMAGEAETAIKKHYRDVPLHIERVKEPQHQAFGNGTGIILMAESTTGCLLGGSALGKRGVTAEEVGQEAAKQLLDALSTRACVDCFLQDQLIILMALSRGVSRVSCGPITLHTQTAVEITKILTKVEFKVEQIDEDKNIISCEGIGLQNEQL